MMTLLTIRALHILCAALWLGGAMLTTVFLVPALGDVGPDAGKVMGALEKRKMMAYLPSVAGITMLTGLWLYWRLTAGFDPAISRTTMAMVFGTGGVLGIIAGVGGDLLVGRRMKRAVSLTKQAMALPEGPERAALLRAAGDLRRAAGQFARVVVTLLVVTLVLMSVGHYV